MNFASNAPLYWKRSIIKCFLQRAYTLCTTWKSFDKETRTLKRHFSGNGYPQSLFDNVLRTFLVDKKSDNPKLPRDREKYCIVLPYFGSVSDRFSNRFRSLCNRYNLNARVVFRPFKIGSYFCHKSRVPMMLKSLVVYKYACPVDPVQIYVGRTKRHLLTRIREHGKTQSAVSAHNSTCKCFDKK